MSYTSGVFPGPGGLKSYSQVGCSALIRSPRGRMVQSSIGTDFVAIDVDSSNCGSKSVQVRVPRAEVEALILDR